MSGILTPGYLRWDGTKYVLDNDVEIVGPAGAQGPSGAQGPAGPAGPSGTPSGDLLGTYPGPVSVIGLTGVSGIVSFGATATNPTITQPLTSGNTGQALTLKAQAAATTGGNVVIQSGTGTTAGIIQFLVGNNTSALIDANQTFRIGPNASSSSSGPNGSSPVSSTDYIYGNNSVGSMFAELFSGGSSQRAGYSAYNTAAGGTSINGISIQAPGSTYSFASYQGQGVLEQAGPATSALILSKVLGNGTSRGVTGRVFQSGAWSVGDLSSSSTTNQAGLTGPLINFAAAGGSLTSTTGQALIYATASNLNLQGHLTVNMVAGTTTVATANTTKFVTLLGRRVKITGTTATTYNVLTTDEVIAIGAISAPITVNLPTSPTTGDTYTVKDVNGNASSFTITISGNGINIDGVASIAVNTPYTEAVFTYNGTTWSSSLANNVSPNTGYSSVVNVPSGGAVNVVGLDQLFLCDPTSSSCTVTAPSTPVANLRFTVKDATNKANVNQVIISGNGRNVENPFSLGNYSTPISITTASFSAVWAYDPTRNRYTVVAIN